MVMETAFRSEETFTQEEFRHWLDERPASDVNHYELIRGRIVMSPPAGWRHGGVGARLVSLIDQHVRAKRLGRIFDSSTGYELRSGDTLEPDASLISQARWDALAKPVPDGFLKIAPDLVIEILSASTAKRDRTEKFEIYSENGVREYWLVDKDKRKVTMFFRDRDGLSSSAMLATGRLPSRVLPDLEVTVEQIFVDLD
jgi:Uma2 family endonuclease